MKLKFRKKSLTKPNIRFLLFGVFVLTCCFNMSAQSPVVKGNVTSEGEPLPGVGIIVKGTSRGATSDFDGNFELKATDGEVLVFSYMGFITKEVKATTAKSLKVILNQDISTLEEVVVVGYGTQKKKEITGAVVKVEAAAIEVSATADVASALQGQIAGVNVQASSGDPGAGANIIIRGLSSVYGNNTPLYVVDGIPYEGDPKLSVEEIESIDVLKDDASAAIYGTRGAAGVILITTKKGEEGTMKMSFSTYYGVQSITSGVPLLNNQDRLYVDFLSSTALQGKTYGNTWTRMEPSPHSMTNNTNLINTVENNYAPIKNHSIRVSGGQNGLVYSFTGNYFDQEGVIIKSGYKRLNLRQNTQFKKGKWNVSTVAGFRTEDTKHAPWGLLLDANSYNASQPELTVDSNGLEDAGSSGGSEAENLTFLGRKLIQEDDSEVNTFDANLRVAYNFTKNLKFTSRVGVLYSNGTRITVNPLYVAYNYEGEEIPTERSKIRNTASRRKNYSLENIINYNKRIGKHQVKLLGVYSRESFFSAQFFGEKFDIADNNITVLNGATSPDANAGSGTGQWNQDKTNTLIGYLGRFQYNYDGKYLLSASVRRDGSSRFQKEHWGTFPSISLGWNVAEENFWAPVKRTVNSFKLRASRGTTGNQGIADYSYSPVLVLENDYVFNTGSNQNLESGLIQQAYANPDVKWETSTSTNLGFDMSFFRNALQVTGDFYKADKRDMLFPFIVPPSQGVGSGNDAQVVSNVGDMQNKGTELAVNYTHRGKMTIKTGLTYTRNVNKITKMSDTNKEVALANSQVSNVGQGEDLVSFLKEGYVAGAFFLIKTDGIVQPEDLEDYKKIQPTAQAGDLKYIDANNDGVLDINDRQFAGSGTPDYEIGWNFNANYKHFDFTMQWYGSFGAEILNGSKAYTYKRQNHRDLIYQWSPQNPTSNIPVNRGDSHENYRGQTDLWLEDGSFIRLRNITLGYTIPKNVLKESGISRLRLYTSAQNPITITKYTGYDPEVGNNGLSTRGIDRGTYPVSSVIRLGLQLDF